MDLWKNILDLLYPSRCPFCGRVLEVWEEDGMCSRCQKTLPWLQGEEKRVEFCHTCLSPLWYQDGVRRGMHRYKFWGGQEYAQVFGMLMAQCLSDRWGEPMDCLTWVPLSAKKLRRRGYDQSQLLAQRVGELTGLEVISTLDKVRHTSQQSRIVSPSARRANVAGAYQLREGVDVAGKYIVLVDDVLTSGSTLEECAACLRTGGAEQVVGLTLARARSEATKKAVL